MNTKKAINFSLTVSFFLLAAAGAARADWPNFRGPNYDGKSPETGFKKKWDTPLPLVWERDVGSAFSSFAVVGDRVFTCGMKDGKQVLFCLNAGNGEVVWQNAFEQEYRNEHGDGTRATPTVSDGRVYILGAHGRLLCADAQTGNDLWDKKFSHQPTWAYSGSVLIEGDLAIVSAGQEYGALAAFRKDSGEPVWKSGNDHVGYATPYPFTFHGQRYIAALYAEAAVIVDAKDGREVWRTPWKTDWDVNASMPIFHDGHLYIGTGYRTGGELFRLSPSGDKLDAQSVWKSKVLLNKFQSCVLHEGKLYTSDQKAMKCVDFLTGREAWSNPRIKHSPLFLADGHLVMLTQEGELQIGPASPGGFEPTTKAEILSGRCWSVPVLNDGKLYARNLERIVCFDLRG